MDPRDGQRGAPRRRGHGPALLILALLGGVAGTAEARTSKNFPYPVAQVWPAAVRHLRIDEKLKIVEKDAEAGYVVFELTAEGKVFHGAMELITVDDPELGATTRAFISIQNRPAYIEEAILYRFEGKLRDERGPPIQRKPVAKPKKTEKKPEGEEKAEEKAEPPPDAS